MCRNEFSFIVKQTTSNLNINRDEAMRRRPKEIACLGKGT